MSSPLQSEIDELAAITSDPSPAVTRVLFSAEDIRAREWLGEKFTAAGATIIGVSLDSIERLNAFSADPQYCAGKIPVASDAKGEVARAFDLPITEIPAGKTDTRGIEIGHARTERTTFIVTPDGKIAATIGGLTPQANVEKALEAVQSLHLSSSAKP